MTVGGSAARPWAPAPPNAPVNRFRYCLNTSTLRGQKLDIEEEVALVAEAGYDGIEPWIRELDAYAQAGGSLERLGGIIRDAGLEVPSAIGFFEWDIDDPERRAAGLDEAKRSMEVLAAVGGTRIAAPPLGNRETAGVDLLVLADRYRALLELGETIGVVPQLEVWGFSKTLSRLGESLCVAVESGRRDACLLPDVYHLYKGGSSWNGLRLVHGAAMHVFHLNDYPAEPPRETISDADRVFPGDGVAPLDEIFAIFESIGFRGTLSLELFNPEYWKRDALAVAREGLEKMRRVAEPVSA